MASFSTFRRAVGAIVAALLLSTLASFASADPGRLIVRVDQPGHKISPTLYGLMTEEINHSYDGGLYGELIQNRIFRDNPRDPVHWSLVASTGAQGNIGLDGTDPINTTALTTALRLTINNVGPGGRVGVANDGYWGIPLRPNTRYTASFYAQASDGFAGPLTVDVEGNDGTVYVSATVPAIDTAWKRYSVSLTTGQMAPSAANRFVISGSRRGVVFLNLVSLFPPTYKNRANGNRIDIMEKLAAMQPAFLRLPGGNYLEGDFFSERFVWKDTVGPLERRPGHRSPWNYRSTDGLGLLEFCAWCEDLNMEPVLGVFDGYALRGEHIDAGPKLVPYVQEALDEIEYVTGDRTTKGGQQRAADGHPDPFKLTYVEIGNEEGGDAYNGRFAQFYGAIKAKYPKLQIIATSPVRSVRPDVIDDHYYRSARDMQADVHHYDNYSRSGPKIFIGEWATMEGNPTPSMNAALGDAAWLTGIERNSDLIVMAAYAPLLVHVGPGGAQWPTNLIGYDAMTSFGSPSYHVQRMFNVNRGDTVLPVEIVTADALASAPAGPRGAVGVGTWATSAQYRDLKVTRGDAVAYQSDFAKGAAGWFLGAGEWKTQEGTLAQNGAATDCRATVGDTAWTDYTYALKARKISGAEGFLILFHVEDADNYAWWNIGGWGNVRTNIERSRNGSKREIGQSADVTVEANRWYDVRIEVKGPSIKCYLDDKLVSEATDEATPTPAALFAAASRVDSTGEVIVKFVNTLAAPQTMDVALQGMRTVHPVATAEVISGQPGDVNTIAAPDKVAPRRADITNATTRFTREFPAHSVTVMRFKPQ